MRSILVIDSNPELRSFVCDVLARGGHTVRATHDVHLAAALLRAEPADLVVTDLTSAHPRATETIEALRREFPAIETVSLAGAPIASGFLRLAATLGGRRTREQPFLNRELRGVINEMVSGVAAYTAYTSYRSSQRELPSSRTLQPTNAAT